MNEIQNSSIKVGRPAQEVSTRVGGRQRKSIIQSGRLLSEIPDDVPVGLTPEERAEVYYQMPESKRPLLPSLPQEDIEAIKMKAHELDSLDAEAAASRNKLFEKRKKLAEARARGRARPRKKPQEKTTSRVQSNTSNMTPEQRKQAAIQRGRAIQPNQETSPQNMLEAAKARGSAIGGDIVENGVDEVGNPVIIGDISGGADDFLDNSRGLYWLDG